MAQELEFGLDTFGDVTVGPDGTPLHAGAGDPQRRRRGACSPTRSASTSSASASTTATTSPSPRPRSCWPRSPAARSASASARRSPCSARTTRSASSSASRRSTPLSNGRAEVILGRGSFTESFPLFGFDLDRLRGAVRGEARPVRRAARRSEPVTWAGTTRAPLAEPAACSRRTESAAAADLDRRRRQPGVGRARRALRPAAHARDHRRRPGALRALRRPVPPRPARSSAAARLPIGVHSPGYVADTDEQAREELWPHYRRMRDRIGAERGWPPTTPRRVRAARSGTGSLYVGSPETVARKIAATVEGARHRALRPEVQRRHAAARAS